MRAYQDMVFTTAFRLVANDAQAEDISQEVFVRAYQHFADLKQSPSAGGWLKTVATNLSLNHLSRYRKRWRLFSELKQADEDEAEIDWESPDNSFADLNSEQRAQRVNAALQQLPPHQRVPLVLFHFEELPYEDIATKLGASLSKIKTDIRRGRAALLIGLKSAGVESEQDG